LTSASAGAATGAALYVYGITDAQEPPTTAGVSGDVEALREGTLTVLVSRVGLEEFDQDPLRARLEDPAWVAEKAMAHEAVLEAAVRSGAVVPFRFLTIYKDEGELRRFVSSRSADLRTVLDHVRGKVEVGIKAFVDRATLERAAADRPELVRLDDELAKAQPGRAYLLQRRRDQAVREGAARLSAEVADASHARLLAVSDDGVANPVQAHDVSGRAEDMLLNAAYLVGADDGRLDEELDALRDRYGQLGVTFERTGPWPAYNFVPRELGE
jgi:Gas vesicle synthesis protein GvpL/GvpF